MLLYRMTCSLFRCRSCLAGQLIRCSELARVCVCACVLCFSIAAYLCIIHLFRAIYVALIFGMGFSIVFSFGFSLFFAPFHLNLLAFSDDCDLFSVHKVGNSYRVICIKYTIRRLPRTHACKTFEATGISLSPERSADKKRYLLNVSTLQNRRNPMWDYEMWPINASGKGCVEPLRKSVRNVMQCQGEVNDSQQFWSIFGLNQSVGYIFLEPILIHICLGWCVVMQSDGHLRESSGSMANSLQMKNTQKGIVIADQLPAPSNLAMFQFQSQAILD